MNLDYAQKPMLIYWETTRACPLACRHCRAEAIPWRHPLELSTEEGDTMLERLARFGAPLPHLVLTGGDPLQRPDLFHIISRAREMGFTVAVTPAGTPDLTQSVVWRLRDSGVWMLALSLDGSTAARHDSVRGVAGSFSQTVQACRWAAEAGIPVQVNTVVSAETVDDVPALCDALKSLDIAQWALFFLIQVGRGAVLQEVTPEQSEEVMRWADETGPEVSFRIRTTEAPHYRRLVLQREVADRHAGDSARSQNEHIRRAYGVRDGNGIMFISHTGEVYPSGFLPLRAGNVRRDDPVDLYRQSPTFQQLRAPDRLKGKCGRCAFRHICGGSRARAYAATGDPLESDPLCPYQPQGAERPVSVAGGVS